MHLRMDALSAAERYKLLAGTVVPRPIAWVSTLSAAGVGNVAPYSFFNMIASAPPLVVLGAMRGANGGLKDTATNILETKEFVVNLVSEPMLEAMNLTCVDAPPEIDEAALAGLEMLPSELIAPPRIAGAPVSLECRLYQAIDAPPGSTIILGEVVAMTIDERFVDAATLRPDPVAMQLMGRVHGVGGYTRIRTDRTLARPVYEAPPAARGGA
ncbi:flavin reductase family protein [Novosphingobium sp.]|uniref:flavin reductase family protein n=1 Tax=Novosphingobium sp. TaxID=1874826 RepID=UPI003BAB545F